MLKDEKEIIGVVQLPVFDEERIDFIKLKNWTLKQMQAHASAGITTVMLQDQTPGKQADLKAVTYMAALGRVVKETLPMLKLGMIFDANDGTASLYAANAAGADFVRIKVFVGAMLKAGGVIEGEFEAVRRTKVFLDREIEVYADIYDRMGKPLEEIPLEIMAAQAAKYGADRLILTGRDEEETLYMLDKAKQSVPGIPILVGGGAHQGNIKTLLQHADGAIVSSCFMSEQEENTWDLGKMKRFMGVLCS